MNRHEEAVLNHETTPHQEARWRICDQAIHLARVYRPEQLGQLLVEAYEERKKDAERHGIAVRELHRLRDEVKRLRRRGL